MNVRAHLAPPPPKGWIASLLVTAAFAGFVSVPLVGIMRKGGGATTVAYLLAIGFSAAVLLAMLRTGKIHRWRRVFFSTYAGVVAFDFLWFSLVDRGGWITNESILFSEGAPMCDLVVPSMLLPLLGHGELIVPNDYLFALSFLLLFALLGGLLYGKGFCAWICFYGGQEDLFAGLLRRPRWRIRALPMALRYLPFAFLVFVVLLSLQTMVPVYCTWFCPFRVTTEYVELSSPIRVLQLVVFVALWLSLVVTLPLLTRKRTQCTVFCPVGAFYSLFEPTCVFALRIHKDRCIDCGECVEACPTFSMTDEVLARGKPAITCHRCGACVDICPTGALQLGIKGVPFTAADHPLRRGDGPSSPLRRLAADLWDPGVVFVFGALALGTLICAQFAAHALLILHAVVT